MPAILKAEIDIRPVLQLASGLSEFAISNAWRRALRKTGDWVKTHVARTLSSDLKVPQRVLKQRLYFFLRSNKMMEGKVWLGLNEIEARRLGSPRQTRTGVTVGRHRFDHAWIYQTWRNTPKNGGVFRRTGKFMTIRRHHYTNGPKGREWWTEERREAYEEVRFEWDEAGERAFREIAARAQARLFEILEQELRWEISKVTR